MNRILFLFYGSVITSLIAVAMPSVASPSIKVQSHTSIKGVTALKLSHIVSAKNLSPSLKDMIDNVELGNAPKPGEKRIYSASALAEILRQIVSESGAQGVQLSIPSKIVIENQGIEFNKKEVEKKLRGIWKSSCSDCKFDQLLMQLPRVSESILGHSWTLVSDGKVPRRNFNYKVTFNTLPARSFWVNGQVRVSQKVMVTKRAMGYRESIRPEDVSFEYRDISFANDSSPTIKDLKSVTTRRMMRAGEIVWHGSLKKEKKVRRGDLVRAILSEGGFRIGMSGVAQEDGYVGKMIKVKSNQTKKILVGRVNEDGEIEVQ